MASAMIRNPAMPASSSSRSVVRDGVRALASQTYPPYIHHSAPNTSSTRNPSATVTSCDKIPVSWVIAKTKTRSKNSSRVLTRSGRSPSVSGSGSVTALASVTAGSGLPRRDVVPVPAAAQLHRGGQLIGGRARGRDVRTRADRVQHPAARRAQGSVRASGRAGVEEVRVPTPFVSCDFDLVALGRVGGIAFGGDHHGDGGAGVPGQGGTLVRSPPAAAASSGASGD